MKTLTRPLAVLFSVVLFSALFLSGCVFPVRRVSLDPNPNGPAAQVTGDAAVFTMPAPDGSAPSAAASLPAVSDSFSASGIPVVSEPRLAVFWYAMADAHVFELREAFGPVLDSSGIPYREYDAENDRRRQTDQMREAADAGWNVFAVQLVVNGSIEFTREILDAAGDCPVIFFDRTPDPEQLPSLSPAESSRTALIRTDPAETGQVQGQMIGEFLLSHFSVSDLNQDGRIRYTFLVGDADDPAALTLTRSALDTANAILAQNGYRALSYLDEDNTVGWQADPGGSWSSNAGTDIIRSDLGYYNYANSNMIELIAANNDDMALGALTALQSAWCNLGDGTSVTIPLFGLGGSPAALSAVGLGQMTGTVGCNAAAYAEAVLAVVRGLSACGSLDEALSAAASGTDDCRPDDSHSSVLYITPVPVFSGSLP